LAAYTSRNFVDRRAFQERWAVPCVCTFVGMLMLPILISIVSAAALLSLLVTED